MLGDALERDISVGRAQPKPGSNRPLRYREER
jgi:hypothetical protein